MELSKVGRLFVPEGEVKEIRIGNTLIWKATAPAIHIKEDDTQVISDFFYYKEGTKDFTVKHNLPDDVLENNTFEWTVTGLPAGLTATHSADGLTLTVSGFAEKIGTSQVTITLTLGEYTDTKIFTFDVTDDGKGLTLTTEASSNFAYGLSNTHNISVTSNNSNVNNIGRPTAKTDDTLPSWLTISGYQASVKLLGTPPVESCPSDLNSLPAVVQCNVYGQTTNSDFGNYKTPKVPVTLKIYPVLLRCKYNRVNVDLTCLRNYTGERNLIVSDWIYPVITEYNGQPIVIDGKSPAVSLVKPIKPLNYDGTYKSKLYYNGNIYYLDCSFTIEEIFSSSTKLSRVNILMTISNTNTIKVNSASSNNFTIDLTNGFGSVSIPVTVTIASKADYNANPSNYLNPIITYS